MLESGSAFFCFDDTTWDILEFHTPKENWVFVNLMVDGEWISGRVEKPTPLHAKNDRPDAFKFSFEIFSNNKENTKILTHF